MTITIREPGSAFTHLAGMILAVFASIPLLIKAALNPDQINVIAMTIFMFSMILLYGASTLYHSVNLTETKLKIFRKIDHMMIFVLIAGSYTPICLLVLNQASGQTLLITVWTIAIIGMFINAFWITCPKWFSSIIYIAMGWICLSKMGELMTSLSAGAFGWLLAGGIFYTVGGVIYALKLPLFQRLHPYFGIHEIFHLFVMAGSICHFVCMYWYVI